MDETVIGVEVCTWRILLRCNEFAYQSPCAGSQRKLANIG
jgi:hypothetical protein